METPRKADPSIYPKLREQAFAIRLPNLSDHSIHAVLMDWPLGEATVTVLAAADGTASIYLSNGGGFIGGGQKYPTLRSEALCAVQIAQELLAHFALTESHPLPTDDEIFFYATRQDGALLYKTTATALQSGQDPLASLGSTLQNIITQYRLNQPQP